MQPFNYQQQVVNPFEQAIGSAMQGFKFGAGVREIQEKRQASQEAEARKQELLQKFAEFQSKPDRTVRDYESLAMLLPKDQAENLLNFYKQQTEETQRSEKKFSGQIASALLSPNEESRTIGINLLRQRAQAARNAGKTQEAESDETYAKLAETSPEIAKSVADQIMTYGTFVFGKDWADGVLGVQQRPALVAESVAKAKKAGIDANFAEAEIVSRLNLNKAQIDNYASQQEIARENLKIAKLNSDLQREQNALKRQELQQKIDDAKKTRDEKVVQAHSEANNILANFDNALNTVDRVLGYWEKDKSGKIVPGKANATARAAMGPLDVLTPTIQTDVADFEELVKSLESQAFLSQVDKMRGLGALTEREGGRLVNALGSLSLRQSPERLAQNLLEIQRLMLKGRTEVERKYGVNLAPDRPAGPGGSEVPAPQVPSAMGQATSAATRPAMPSGFRVLGVERPR